MVAAPARKTNASKSRSPAKDRKSASRTQSAEASLVSSAPSSPAKTETPRTARYSHHLPTDQQRKGNGRVAGRNLIMWNRMFCLVNAVFFCSMGASNGEAGPRMAEKLLLHIHYECSRHKLQLPWDAIAHRFHPGSSGAAIIQHINRLRREVLVEGHLVPPLTQRSSATPNDPNLRGYVRRDTEATTLKPLALCISTRDSTTLSLVSRVTFPLMKSQWNPRLDWAPLRPSQRRVTTARTRPLQ